MRIKRALASLGTVALILLGLTGLPAQAEDKAEWSKTALSDLENYEVKLDCSQKPSVGKFQDCKVKVTKRNDQEAAQTKPSIGEKVSAGRVQAKNAKQFSQSPKVSIDGGMLAHGHGLPTAPVAMPISDDQYAIRGLKFNMPGFWFLKVEVAETGKKPEVSLFALNVPEKLKQKH